MTVNKTLTHVGGDVGGDFTATLHVFEMLTKNVGVRHTATMWAYAHKLTNKDKLLGVARTRARVLRVLWRCRRYAASPPKSAENHSHAITI